MKTKTFLSESSFPFVKGLLTKEAVEIHVTLCLLATSSELFILNTNR